MTLPIRLRLSLVYAATFLVLVVAIAVGAYASAVAAVESVVDQELESRLTGVVDHLTRHVAKVPWPELAESLHGHSAFQPDWLRIGEARGVVRFEGAALRGVAAPPAGPEFSMATHTTPSGPARLLSVQRTILGQRYELVLGTDMALSAAVLDRLATALVVLVPAALLGACWAGYLMGGRALQPVSTIIASARAIDASRLSERIAVARTGDEVEQLAITFNGMLDRIEHGFTLKRRFTADASHELRTPVAIIRAAAEVALVDPRADAARYREALRRILHEAEQSSALLEDLLYLARADAGTEPRRNDAVDLTAQVTQLCAQVAPLAERRRVALRVATNDAVTVNGDAMQLRRLALILIDNAIHHTASEGHVVVSTGCERERPYCEVKDTGCGIEPDHLPRIFERFYRVDRARTRTHGSGLGLAIAERLASLHGASISVASTPGVGTTFRVSFPAPVVLAPAV